MTPKEISRRARDLRMLTQGARLNGKTIPHLAVIEDVIKLIEELADAVSKLSQHNE